MSPDVLDQKIQKAKSLGYSQDQIDSYLQSKGVTPPASSFFGRVAADFKERNQNVAEAKGKVQSGQQGLGSGLLQAGGQVAGAALDVVGEGINSIPGAKDAISSVTKPIAESAPVQSAVKGYEEWKANHPEAAANLEAGTNILSVLPLGGVGPVAKAVKTGVTVAKDAAIDTTKALVKAPSRIVENAVATPIPKPVEAALKGTPVDQFDNYVNIASKAATSNKEITPLEFAGQRAVTALGSIQDELTNVGKQKQAMMGTGGIAITPVDGNMVRKFRQGLASYTNSKTAVEGDSKLIRDITSEAKKLGDFPAAGQVDRFIDFVQDKVYTSGRDLSVPVTDETTARIRSLVESLNGELKNQLPKEYRTVNSEYSRLINLRNELNTKLGKEGEKGGALLKRVFSPSDASTKKLFAEVKAQTGIDLVDEATLAKFVMEILGDSRQKSMLEQLQLLHTSPTPNGIAGKLLERLVSHFNTPESQIQRARKQTVPKAKLLAPKSS